MFTHLQLKLVAVKQSFSIVDLTPRLKINKTRALMAGLGKKERNVHPPAGGQCSILNAQYSIVENGNLCADRDIVDCRNS